MKWVYPSIVGVNSVTFLLVYLKIIDNCDQGRRREIHNFRHPSRVLEIINTKDCQTSG